jgi:hypothetical protein
MQVKVLFNHGTLIFGRIMPFNEIFSFRLLSSNSNVTSGVAKKGMCPLLFGGLEGGGGFPLIAKKIWTCDRLKMASGRF